jgi:hypothetical protein
MMRVFIALSECALLDCVSLASRLYGRRPFTDSPILPAYCLFLLRGDKSIQVEEPGWALIEHGQTDEFYRGTTLESKRLMVLHRPSEPAPAYPGRHALLARTQSRARTLLWRSAPQDSSHVYCSGGSTESTRRHPTSYRTELHASMSAVYTKPTIQWRWSSP